MNVCVQYIMDDLFRYSGSRSMKAFLRQYIHIGEGFRFSVWLRICHFTYNKYPYRYILFPLSRMLYRHYKYKYGYDIPYEREIGAGLLLFHFGGIVFVPEKCGKNATISHQTTVGMRMYNGIKKYPTLGDNVYMAPGAKVVGDIMIGNGVAIGTGSVVLDSVADNEIVVGIPGKRISDKGSSEYVNNPID